MQRIVEVIAPALARHDRLHFGNLRCDALELAVDLRHASVRIRNAGVNFLDLAGVLLMPTLGLAAQLGHRGRGGLRLRSRMADFLDQLEHPHQKRVRRVLLERRRHPIKPARFSASMTMTKTMKPMRTPNSDMSAP